jgi:hypothetical protein
MYNSELIVRGLSMSISSARSFSLEGVFCYGDLVDAIEVGTEIAIACA